VSEILEPTHTPTREPLAGASTTSSTATTAPTVPGDPTRRALSEPEKAPSERPAPKPPAVTLTISEAARSCGVNRRTIRHHRQAGDFPGAFKDQDGMWRIPVEDLEWVGLHPDLGRASEDPMATGKVDLLRTEVAVLRERLRAAELIAMEREKRIEDLRLILRMLPASSLGRGSAGGLLGSARARLTAGKSQEGGSTAAEAPSEPVIWLPDAPDPRAVPLSSSSHPAGTGSNRGSIWTPDAMSSSREKAEEPAADEEPSELQPPFFGPPVQIRSRRRRWLPWQRSRT